VLVQILSSDEQTKHGIEIDKANELISYIRNECPLLRFKGLMTMGLLKDIEGFKVRFINLISFLNRLCTILEKKSFKNMRWTLKSLSCLWEHLRTSRRQ
jgi:uncharacterized pyridoxal phosphate-containing UPF0001 family protein